MNRCKCGAIRRPLSPVFLYQRTDAVPKRHTFGIFCGESVRVRAPDMDGGRSPFHRQRKPIIELLEFCNVFRVAGSLAHDLTIPLLKRLPSDRRPDAESRKARREGTQTGPSRSFGGMENTDAPQPLYTIKSHILPLSMRLT